MLLRYTNIYPEVTDLNNLINAGSWVLSYNISVVKDTGTSKSIGDTDNYTDTGSNTNTDLTCRAQIVQGR